MDSLNRIFNCINEAKGKGKAMIPKHHEKKGGKKSPLGKANPYDHDSFGNKNEEKRYADYDSQLQGEYEADERKAANSQLAKEASLAARKKAAKVARMKKLRKGKKINASTEIADILGIIKEAYDDNLISEEAFLAIANPILKSLQEERKRMALKDPRTGKTFVYDPESGLTPDERQEDRTSHKGHKDRRKR